jgi:hypothetical protein
MADLVFSGVALVKVAIAEPVRPGLRRSRLAAEYAAIGISYLWVGYLRLGFMAVGW